MDAPDRGISQRGDKFGMSTRKSHTLAGSGEGGTSGSQREVERRREISEFDG